MWNQCNVVIYEYIVQFVRNCNKKMDECIIIKLKQFIIIVEYFPSYSIYINNNHEELLKYLYSLIIFVFHRWFVSLKINVFYRIVRMDWTEDIESTIYKGTEKIVSFQDRQCSSYRANHLSVGTFILLH